MNIKTISAVGLALCGFALIGAMEFEDQQLEDDHYCQMRRAWDESNVKDPSLRAGWPNFKPEINCEGGGK
jgi:hypothetical protein